MSNTMKGACNYCGAEVATKNRPLGHIAVEHYSDIPGLEKTVCIGSNKPTRSLKSGFG